MLLFGLRDSACWQVIGRIAQCVIPYEIDDRMIRTTFSDDTTSGRWSADLRSPTRRVTIVARAEDGHSFNWLAAFKRDFLLHGVEAKSSNVLPIMDAQPRAREYVLRNLGGYSIFIVDLHEFGRLILDRIVDHLRPVIPPGLDPHDFVLRLQFAESNPRQFLRQIAIHESILERLERLLAWCANPFARQMKEMGIESYVSPASVELTDQATLRNMDDRQLASFLARLGAAVGDILSPERLAKALMQCAEDQRYLVGGYVACQLLRVDVETDKLYDIGPAPVLMQLELADNRIWNYMKSQVAFSLENQVRRGALDGRASHTELGLQAADIAAAIASRQYERASDDGEGSRIKAVKQLFDRVCLNGRWM